MSTPRKSVSAALLALVLALAAAPAVHAVPGRSAPPASRSAISVRSLLTSLWSAVVGTTTTDPRAPKPTQGPSIDPNGAH